MICPKIVIILTVFVTATTMSIVLPQVMRAVALYKYLPVTDPNCLVDVDVPVPSLQNNDILVEVKSISVNPIDTKMRGPKPIVEKEPKILGVDGSGVVVAVGNEAKIFKEGDEVIFMGDMRRSGTYAQYVALNQMQATFKPKNVTFEEAAAMPWTSVTAYECLADRLQISEKDKGKSLLIINSAGGVGTVASQLAKNFGLKVIGTASRPETMDFARKYGADVVLNHTQDLLPQLEANGYGGGVDYILVLYDPYPYWETMIKAIKAQGKICVLCDCSGLVDIRLLKDKSLTLVSENLGTRMRYNTDDKFRQKVFLNDIAKMMEEGKLKSTLMTTLTPINAVNLKKAHELIEGKRSIGKIVISGF